MSTRDFATTSADLRTTANRGNRGNARPTLERLNAERAAFEAARRARGVPTRGVLYRDEPDAQ